MWAFIPARAYCTGSRPPALASKRGFHGEGTG